MADFIQQINPLSGFFDMTVDPVSLNIPDGTPDIWDASGGTLPNTQPNVGDRRVISGGGILPPPIGAVEPHDYIVWDGANRFVVKGTSNATQQIDGLMSKEDKFKLDALNWTMLKNQWTIAPVLYDMTNDYELWEYTYGATKLYRKVPVVYSPANDIFYSDDTMTIVAAKRDLILN